MIKIILCDDEAEIISRVKNLIRKVLIELNPKEECEIISFNGYCEELQQTIDDNGYQKIYLLDIEMDPVSGIEIAVKIREKDRQSILSFLTVHDQEYDKDEVLKARLSIYDYISKNQIYENRLKETIEKSINDLLGDDNKVLKFKYDRTLYHLKYNDIIYIEKEKRSKKCIIYTEKGKKYSITSSLSKLEEKLDDDSFIQSHRAYLVNVNKIDRINSTEKCIVFTNGSELIMLSDKKKKGFIDYVANY